MAHQASEAAGENSDRESARGPWTCITTYGQLFEISFRRTVRVADHEVRDRQKITKKLHDVDAFPICRMDDYMDELPEDIRKKGGSYFFPMSRNLLPFLAILI